MKYERLIKIIVVAVSTFLFVPNLSAQSHYKLTPRDMEGPFYPIERQPDEDNDLLNVEGKSSSASGDVLFLAGVVTDQKGHPRSNIIVEIWQTDARGLYRHPQDRSAGARDPFFQYWGRAYTDKEGKYSFKTIIPGKYEPRPAHIHFKVWVDDKVVLTSQMYIVKGETNPPQINELLALRVTKNNDQKYHGFFRIVL
jgi:protocatechuate 3,4-dioxygenase beta subunit